LQDVNLEVSPGEVVGIVGRNGAGKSTLLKVLSRITEPSAGRVELFGRVGSLLEVGTGFHPELTGRENIFLNGAFLGMSRREIVSKFDEIVAFSEIEKFIDTPVKRYSSGMYMRLAFAVAAHLEPEILIVDEVLAVGDAAFQQKCVGKMADVAREGRTVLFVSHNMAAVRALCNRAVLMSGGRAAIDADVETCIGEYLADDVASESVVVWDEENAPQTPELCFRKGYVLDGEGRMASTLDYRKPFSIVVEYEVLRPIKNLRIGFMLQNGEGVPICGSNDPDAWPHAVRGEGRYVSRCTFPGNTLNSGTYLVSFGSDRPPFGDPLVTTPFCLSFHVEDMEGHGSFNHKLPGVIRPKLRWDVTRRDGAGLDAGAPAGANAAS
jgi:lipopolysaccharide transport system ATP-binding protein